MGGGGEIRRKPILSLQRNKVGEKKKTTNFTQHELWSLKLWRHLQARLVICTLKDSVWTHWEALSQLKSLLSRNTRQRMKGNPQRTSIKGHAVHGTTKARAQCANQDHSRTIANVSFQRE